MTFYDFMTFYDANGVFIHFMEFYDKWPARKVTLDLSECTISLEKYLVFQISKK
jgi:hypothetical protein